MEKVFLSVGHTDAVIRAFNDQIVEQANHAVNCLEMGDYDGYHKQRAFVDDLVVIRDWLDKNCVGAAFHIPVSFFDDLVGAVESIIPLAEDGESRMLRGFLDDLKGAEIVYGFTEKEVADLCTAIGENVLAFKKEIDRLSQSYVNTLFEYRRTLYFLDVAHDFLKGLSVLPLPLAEKYPFTIILITLGLFPEGGEAE